MRADRVRIVLDSSVTEDDLDPFFVDPYNWMIKERIAQKGDQPREYIYGTEDLKNDIHFISDHKIGVKYLLVSGPDAKHIEQYLRESRLLSWHPDAIIERARDSKLSREDRRQALYHLALDKMERGFDQETLDIYSKAMTDADSFVRASAVLGSAYLAWPQLAKPLRPLATDAEPDAGIRKDAALLVGRLDALAGSSN